MKSSCLAWLITCVLAGLSAFGCTTPHTSGATDTGSATPDMGSAADTSTVDVGSATDTGFDVGSVDDVGASDTGSFDAALSSDTGIDSAAADVGTGRPCGARGLLPCPTGQFCDFPITANCGATGLPGACTIPPTRCPVATAVCSCNGTSYAGTCSAAMAMQSVRHTGVCP